MSGYTGQGMYVPIMLTAEEIAALGYRVQGMGGCLEQTLATEAVAKLKAAWDACQCVQVGGRKRLAITVDREISVIEVLDTHPAKEPHA